MTRTNTLAEHLHVTENHLAPATPPAPAAFEQSDADLLAIILGTGGGGAPLSSLTAALLEGHGGVGGLLRAGVPKRAGQRGSSEGRTVPGPGLGWRPCSRRGKLGGCVKSNSCES